MRRRGGDYHYYVLSLNQRVLYIKVRPGCDGEVEIIITMYYH